MRINTNVSALNAWRNLNATDLNMSKALERLSSGFRINRAADDAAGLAVSEKMRAQVRGLNQAIRNAQDGISMIQTAEGALTETHSILQRMRELADQSANGTLQDSDRSQLDTEFQALISELDRIATTTQFNGSTLLTGGLGSTVGTFGASLTVANGIQNITSNGAAAGTYTVVVDTIANTVSLDDGTTTQVINYTAEPTGFDTKKLNFSQLGIQIEINASLVDITATNTFVVSAGSADLQIGANANQTLSVSIGDMQVAALGLTGGAIGSAANAQTAIGLLDTAIDSVSTQRASLGALQNRLEHTVANLSVASENLSAAESRIRDADMALEMSSFTRSQILLQAGTAMLAQANAKTQGVLQLLR